MPKVTTPVGEFPAAVRAAWQRHARGDRPARTGLTLDRITAAAIAIADEQGLGAIAMSRVAGELGFSPMALYRHVASKDVLLALMVDAASGPAPRTQAIGADWRTGLRTWTSALLAVYLAHAWLVDVPIGGAPLFPNELDWMDWSLAMMAGTGLTGPEQVAVTLLLGGYVRSSAKLEIEIARNRSRATDAAGDDPLFTAVLTTLVSPERLPALSALAAAGVFSEAPEAAADSEIDQSFQFGLERILDGIEFFLARRAAAP